MNTNDLSFGQRIDPENGLVELWLTHGALDAFKKMDLSDKIVWMWGSGMGDAWLNARCKELHIVERNHDWLEKAVFGPRYYFRPCNEGSGAQDMYCEIPDNVRPDVFIVDDAYRYECILKALEYKPCTLIVDNFMQAFVFMCPSAVEALKEYEGVLYEQEDHMDHDGINKWKTGIWNIR